MKIDNILTIKGSQTDMEEDEKMKKLDRDMLISALHQGTDIEQMNKASELGLWQVWAYHCMRYEHVWFPRWVSGYHPEYFEQLLFHAEPPKSCAKCKSKYWNRIPQKD